MTSDNWILCLSSSSDMIGPGVIGTVIIGMVIIVSITLSCVSIAVPRCCCE